MTYEFKKLKKDKASIVPIEDTYTNLDINTNDDITPSLGYRFDAPRRWVTSRYQTKSIGIRDLKLTPSSGDIRCKFLLYANTTITGLAYNWTDTNPDDPEDEDWIPRYIRGSTSHTFDYGYCQCVSSDYNINITPQNNFEEIITNMINFINEASWKSIDHTIITNEYEMRAPREQDSTRSFYYVMETTDTNTNTTTYTALNYINNINYLKVPITFCYEYDANNCNFNIKANNDLRQIVMSNHSKSDNDRTIPSARITELLEGVNDTHWYNYRRTFDVTTKASRTINGTDTPYDTIYLGSGIIYINGYELLLIINKNDTNSIKAVYDLFNQPMPNIDDLPVINLDDGVYVVPFKNRSAFKSHFCYGSGTNKNDFLELYRAPLTIPFNNNFIETNLKLTNVWDRLHLTFHASFAESRHRIIGRIGDHWDTPNKQFIVPSGDQDQFYIRFTTDGTHNILPVGCKFNIDLCFMLNPTNNTATGTHDSFK